MAKATSSNEIVFKVALKDRPGIWRSIVVRGDQTLERLHEEIFRAFDRFDEHLYSFYFPKAPRHRGLVSRRKEFVAPLSWWHAIEAQHVGPVTSGGGILSSSQSAGNRRRSTADSNEGSNVPYTSTRPDRVTVEIVPILEQVVATQPWAMIVTDTDFRFQISDFRFHK